MIIHTQHYFTNDKERQSFSEHGNKKKHIKQHQKETIENTKARIKDIVLRKFGTHRSC